MRMRFSSALQLVLLWLALLAELLVAVELLAELLALLPAALLAAALLVTLLAVLVEALVPVAVELPSPPPPPPPPPPPQALSMRSRKRLVQEAWLNMVVVSALVCYLPDSEGLDCRETCARRWSRPSVAGRRQAGGRDG